MLIAKEKVVFPKLPRAKSVFPAVSTQAHYDSYRLHSRPVRCVAVKHLSKECHDEKRSVLCGQMTTPRETAIQFLEQSRNLNTPRARH